MREAISVEPSHAAETAGEDGAEGIGEKIMITVSQTDEGSRYNVRLSGSLINLLIIGIVSYLRDRRFVRLLTGVLGAFGLFVGGFLFLFAPFIFTTAYTYTPIAHGNIAA